jgi:signal transduction histidine kinase
MSLSLFASTLRIDYTALSFSAPTKVRFRYRLEGFDTQWVDAGTRRQAFYTNLPPRPYRFQVTAINDGIESERSAIWDFSIQPRFYQTGWFYGACVVTMMLTAGGLWRLRSNQIQRRFALVLAERARIAREIHDTLLQSLVGVAIQCESIARQVDSAPQAAGACLTQLRKQVEFFIRETRQSIWDLRSPTLLATDLSQALAQTGERATSDARIGFGFSVIGTPRRCPAKVEEHLLRIGQEATSNAARHACATKLTMQVRYCDDSVTLRVMDDGCGFEVGSAQADGHWGISMMKERAHLVGGSVRIVSSPGVGTEVEVVVPLPPDTRPVGAAADVIH